MNLSPWPFFDEMIPSVNGEGFFFVFLWVSLLTLDRML